MMYASICQSVHSASIGIRFSGVGGCELSDMGAVAALNHRPSHLSSPYNFLLLLLSSPSSSIIIIIIVLLICSPAVVKSSLVLGAPAHLFSHQAPHCLQQTLMVGCAVTYQTVHMDGPALPELNPLPVSASSAFCPVQILNLRS